MLGSRANICLRFLVLMYGSKGNLLIVKMNAINSLMIETVFRTQSSIHRKYKLIILMCKSTTSYFLTNILNVNLGVETFLQKELFVHASIF